MKRRLRQRPQAMRRLSQRPQARRRSLQPQAIMSWHSRRRRRLVFHTAELSTNSLGDFVVFWDSDFQIVFHTAELSTNSLGDFVVFWDSDFQTYLHSVAFNQFPGEFCGLSIFAIAYFADGRRPIRPASGSATGQEPHRSLTCLLGRRLRQPDFSEFISLRTSSGHRPIFVLHLS